MNSLRNGKWCLTLACLLGFWTITQAQQVPPEKFFPEGTTMAFSVNVKSLLESPAFVKHFKEELEKKINENSQVVAMMKTLELDPRKDISNLTFAINNVKLSGPGAPPEADFFVVLKGKFNPDKLNTGFATLIAAAGDKKIATSTYGSNTVYEIKMDRNEKTLYASIVDSGTIIASTVKKQLQDGIERGLGKKPAAEMAANLKNVISKVDQSKSIWGVFTIPDSFKDMASSIPQPEVGEVIESMESQTINLHLTDGASVAMSWLLKDAGAAGKLKGLIEQGRDLAGAMVLNNEQIGSDLAAMIDSIKLATDGKSVSMKMEVKPDLIDKLVKMVKDRQ